MSRKYLWRLWLELIIIITAGGCSSAHGSDAELNNAGAGNEGPVFSLMVGDSDLSGSSARYLSEAYKSGNTLIELLKSSGVATFNEEDYRILTVNKVSLSPDMIWEIQVNGKIITNLDRTLDRKDTLLISAKPTTGELILQPVIFTVNGGSEQPVLTHSYVLPFTDDLSVREVLKDCGMVHLADDNKTVLRVMDYTPLTSEAWKLRVNEKPLLDSGIDMKLRPQDELELSLVLR